VRRCEICDEYSGELLEGVCCTCRSLFDFGSEADDFDADELGLDPEEDYDA